MSEPVNIFDKAVIMKLYMTKPGNRRSVSTSDIEADADKSMLHVSKDILDCEEFTAVTKRMAKLRTDVAKIASPSPLGKGHHLIAMELVSRVDDLVETAKREVFDELLPYLMRVYPQRVAESKRRLNGLARVEDYPAADAFEAAFAIGHDFVSYGTPEKLIGIDPRIYEREVKKAKAKIAEAADMVVQGLAVDMKELVDRMVDRLTPDSDGKPKIFRNSLVENMNEFLADIKIRTSVVDGLAAAADLEAIAEKMKTVLEGVDPETLRTSKSIREYVAQGISTVKDSLDSMVTLRPKRFMEAQVPDPVENGAAA